ncbi:carboxylesterase/lipase family protein [Caulobacter segnis]|uniref:carboxylesterase/lipase family protein n=1 Tax=Caulobacter segnis TaxID=88688 RepID=UPI001CC0BFD2|nr:carboxylesterase family protein [Caulobacter segnis]UAL09520.1 carboxylesterase family protein [Caulobacter segnis]
MKTHNGGARLAALVLSLTGLSLAAAPAAAGPMTRIETDPVTTAAGQVAGTRLASGVKAYLGVPYAKPPTQDLRWKPPQPIRWDGVWNADRKGAECIQVLRPHDINHYFGEEATSEDCLYMNVWTPAGAKPGDKLPVVVFIYGGGGTIGSSGMANYDGEAMARRGAIFVNFNYRVGLLGYLAHPALSAEQGGHSGNYGYLDQNAALKWIRDNIAAFGGDADKVALSGQSFGAGSVAAQIFSPLSKGLFRGAMLSSACNYTGDIAPLSAGEQVGLELQKRLGAADLAAMRNVPADKILAQQTENQVGASVQGIRAPAVIDGYFFTAQKAQVLADRLGSDVPIIASSNGDDIDAGRSPLVAARTVAAFQEAARKMYGADAEAFLKLYPVKSDAEVPAVAHQAATEAGFLQSSRTCAQQQAKFNRSATYVDLFTRKHPYASGVTFADQNPATVGAYHTADVPYWLDTLDKYNSLRPTRVWTDYDRKLTDQMSGALIALAATGSPSTPAMAWPAWTEKEPKYLRFGDAVTVDTMAAKRMDWLAAHPAAGVGLPAPSARPRD